MRVNILCINPVRWKEFRMRFMTDWKQIDFANLLSDSSSDFFHFVFFFRSSFALSWHEIKKNELDHLRIKIDACYEFRVEKRNEQCSHLPVSVIYQMFANVKWKRATHRYFLRDICIFICIFFYACCRMSKILHNKIFASQSRQILKNVGHFSTLKANAECYDSNEKKNSL